MTEKDGNDDEKNIVFHILLFRFSMTIMKLISIVIRVALDFWHSVEMVANLIFVHGNVLMTHSNNRRMSERLS